MKSARLPSAFNRFDRATDGDVTSLSWCGHDWSNWMLLGSTVAQVPRGALGLYRIRANNGSLLYIGEGLIGPPRCSFETAINRSSDQGRIFAGGEPLEYSWVENTTWASHQRPELETDLISAFVEAHQSAPRAQFLG